jgi:hypothetical protein
MDKDGLTDVDPVMGFHEHAVLHTLIDGAVHAPQPERDGRGHEASGEEPGERREPWQHRGNGLTRLMNRLFFSRFMVEAPGIELYEGGLGVPQRS